ncbi:MAG: phage recombination protein Bet [Gammaproteobacteria bacterium]
MAERFGVDAKKLVSTLMATVFHVEGQEISNEQMMSLMVVADQYGLNPFTRELYAFPHKSGIVPIVGLDGWSRIINDHPQFDGMDFMQEADYCTCIIHRKDRSHPIKVTEYMSECKRETPPWKSHPRRMLRHKATIQCARLAFGFSGIYDEDEAERIIRGQTIEEVPIVEALPVVAAGTNDMATTGPDTRLISAVQAKMLRKLCGQSVKEFGIGEIDLCTHFHTDKLEQLKLRDYMLAVDLLSKPPVGDAAQA